MSHTLLVADDNATTHRFVGLTFAPEGIEVVSVSDGEEARQRLKAQRPDIVLAATTLPRVDGYELAEFVQTEASLAGVPVLLLASPFDPVDKERAQRAGAAGVVVKPLDPEAVIKWVKDLLERSARPAASPADPPKPQSSATDEYFEHLDRALAARESQLGQPPLDRDDLGAIPSRAISPPDVADAFEAFFAAEQSGETRVPPTAAHPAADSYQQMTTQIREFWRDPAFDRAVREIVTQVAERLVREEIARIRAQAEARLK